MSETTETSRAKITRSRNREKRKFNHERLPTPPPDPMTSDETDPPATPTDFSTEVQFLEYINSLQKTPHLLSTRTDSLLAPIAAADEAFNHLDKLYKLMEQMLNLRQQNAKLQKRVQDLEHLKNLQTMQRHLDNVGVFDNIPEIDDDSSFAESLLDTILSGSKKDVKYKPWVHSRLRQSLMKRQHNRSLSLNERTNSDKTSRSSTNREKPAKISKWTMVKAAFRWEKASPIVSGAKSQDSGISGMQPLNYEVARYLRVPSTSEDLGISPNDSGAADGSTPGTLSSASSVDEIYCQEHKSDLQISDDDRQSISLDEACFSRDTLRSNLRKSSTAKVNANCDNEHEKPKLSAASDESKNYTSDHDDHSNKQAHHSSKNVFKTENLKQSRKREIPAYIIARYRQAIVEDETGKALKRISKWTRVKKAFLTPTISTVGNHKPKCIDHINTLNLETSRDTRLNINENKSRKVQEEIQKNYRQLQKQLSLEFHDKFREWERMKSIASSNAAASYCRNDANINEQKDQDFRKKMKEWQRIKAQPLSNPNVQIMREENLAPEFKKKLEEWQRIKKQSTKDETPHITKTKKKLGEWPKWKSTGGHKDEPRHNDNQALSDEFIKKLEEWKKIKSKPYESKDRSPSPKSTQKYLQQATAVNQDINNPNELQWFENELNKIEREKQRLEQEKQNFLLREERISRLRRTVLGNDNKKDILIHTQSGYHKFEGISRKFTQRLYEWEKAQGIGPEESTFALLTSQLTPNIKVDFYKTDSTDLPQQYVGTKLVRSKSAESLSISTLVQPILQTSHHPSSLSLNDVDELEKQCMSLSGESSIGESDDSLDKLHIDEPEAVIVEVEDVVEETAAALTECLQEKHFPIYQHQKALSTCEEKLLVEPRIQTIDTKTAEYNYYLIEEIIDLIKMVAEAEQSSREIKPQLLKWDFKTAEELESDPLEDVKPKDKNDIQKLYSDTIFEKLVRLQAIHSRNISDVATKGFDCTNTQFTSPLEAAQDSFTELLQMAEQLQTFLHNRCRKDSETNYLRSADSLYSDVIASTSELTCKLSELKRILTSFYAAFEKTKFIRINKKNLKSSTSLDKEDKYVNKIVKNNVELTQMENTLSVKRMRYRKKSKTMYESDDSDTNDCESMVDQRNKTKITKENIKTVPIDPVLVQKLVIPTKANILNASIQSPISERKPVEVFVKTTRKLFTPIVESQDPVIANLDLKSQSTAGEEIKKECEFYPTDRSLLLLVSPVLQRKPSKEISPSIRLMLAKYNQMICGQDGNGSSRSAGSSGSASPVAWRSPVSERRVLAQKERYLEEIKKSNNKSNEVKKSASIGVLHSNKKETSVQIPQLNLIIPNNNTKSNPGIFRSTSASHIQIPNNASSNGFNVNRQLKLVIPNAPAETTLPYSKLRRHKIQEAKAVFLNSPVTPTEGSLSAPIVFSRDKDKTTKYPSRSRFSQISMGSESSCDSSACEGTLIKSASAGMIHVEQSTYRNIDPALHGDGYLSLPRSVQKQKESFFGGKLALSNIAAKFRKVKMRRHKDNKKMNTVSALCRQSLLVDINSESQENESTEQQNRRDSLTVPLENRASSSEDTSPSSSRSGSWIRRSRIFKNL